MTPSNSGSCAICAQVNPYSNLKCDSCGARLPWVNAASMQQQGSVRRADKGDALSIWLQILSFLVPILGLVIYFAYRANKPTSAKSALVAAACGFLLNLVIMLTNGLKH